MQSFTSPNLQKYSFKPSAKTGGEMRLDDPRTSEPTSPLRTGPAEVMCWQGLGADNGGRADHVVFVPPPTLQRSHTGYLAIQHNGPLGQTKLHTATGRM